MGLKALFEEWQARRDGRKGVQPTVASAARDITGPTGFAYSAAWAEVEKSGTAYLASFDRKIPPSLFVSERDRHRAGQPIPIVERCIEDWGTNAADAEGSHLPQVTD